MSQPNVKPIGLSALIVSTFLSFGMGQPVSSIVLTSNPVKQTSDEKFFCEGKIHGYVTFEKRLVGNQVIEGIWTLPNGSVGHHTKSKVTYPAPGKYLAYLWLEFDDEGGGLLSFNDTDEVEQQKANQIYNGTWSLDVKLNGQNVGQSKFIMDCNLG